MRSSFVLSRGLFGAGAIAVCTSLFAVRPASALEDEVKCNGGGDPCKAVTAESCSSSGCKIITRWYYYP